MELFVRNLILYNFSLKHFSIQSIILEAFNLQKNLLFNSSTRQMFGGPKFPFWKRQRSASTVFFAGNIILCNFRLKHFTMESIIYAAFCPKVGKATEMLQSQQYYKSRRKSPPCMFLPNYVVEEW